MIDRPVAPGRVQLRPSPPGMPETNDLRPPVVGESGDPFTALHVVDLVARMDRGRPLRIADLAARLDATHLDWLFPEPVVADVLLQLQANWMADYRNSAGFVVETTAYGDSVTLEDSSRVDPWIVRQAQRLAGECRERLAEFSRRDRIADG